jgi:hypothetical protein
MKLKAGEFPGANIAFTYFVSAQRAKRGSISKSNIQDTILELTV